MQLSEEDFRKLYEVAGNDFHDRPNFEALQELAQLRRQFEESQRKQEIKDREQAKENKLNKRIAILSVIVAIVSAAFGGASLIVSVISLLG